jgi:hypothetical protein
VAGATTIGRGAPVGEGSANIHDLLSDDDVQILLTDAIMGLYNARPRW